jgi:hypothetical protein
MPLEPPVTRATLPVNAFVSLAAINILLVIDCWHFGLFYPK